MKVPVVEDEANGKLGLDQAQVRLLSLDIFRIEAGNDVFKPCAVDLCAIAQAVALDLRAQASSKRVQIKLSAQPQPAYVQAEDALCYSIVANLTKNAIEAAPRPRSRLHVHNLGYLGNPAALGRKSSSIVAYSGNSDPASQAAQIAQGFDSCLNKPIKREQVHALVGPW